jgi:hypothetical protein
MQQYTSCGVLKGWKSYLDLDKFYGTKEDWLALCKAIGGGEVIPPSQDTKPVDPTIIVEVLANRYGTGDKRREALLQAGYDPDAVQKKINELYGVACSCEPFCRGNKAYLNSIVRIIRKLIKE